MRCCAKCLSVNIPDLETDNQYSNTIKLIRFHIYHLIARCTAHGRLPLNDRNNYCNCKQDSAKKNPQKYTLEKS